MVELALVLPVVLVVILGVLQFALVYHAKDVVTTAAQEGARFAAAQGRTPADGEDRARSVLESGLGQGGSSFNVTARSTSETVTVQAQGEYALIIPWVTGKTISIGAAATVRKEGFRSGP